MGLSKVLVCYNCKFKKTLKHQGAALIIMRNHNEVRDPWDRHRMGLLEADELRSVSSLPLYDGFVYRAVCDCTTALARKTQEGMEYAMQMHLIVGHETNMLRIKNHEPTIEHGFDIKDKFNIPTGELRIFKVPRKEFLSKTKDPKIQLEEQMGQYGITQSDLSKETAITTFDKDIFWVSTKSRSFNQMNWIVFNYLKVYNCPRCGVDSSSMPSRQFETFKKLYWHFYREHYIFKKDVDHKTLEIIQKLADPNVWYDTTISMLQQLVLVEQAMELGTYRKRGTKFTKDRSSNALYQLNRKHGISFEELAQIFFPKNRIGLGAKLFHGMVWTEDDAPDWLDKIVIELGEELGI